MSAMKKKKGPKPQHTLQEGLDGAWRIWFCATGLLLVYLAGVFAVGGSGTLRRCIQPLQFEVLEQTLGCAGLVWLTFGIALALLKRPAFRMRHGLTVLCSAVLLFLYINFLRERTHYWDIKDYVQGAISLCNHEPFHQMYIYPPLLATLCQPLLWLGVGEKGLTACFWCFNWVGFVLFFVLLTKALATYGFRLRIAHYVVFFFLFLNVPVLRTFLYGQVNFHMMNLILFAYLVHTRNKLLSAIALAFAVHLKASPIILVLPFLYVRDLKWLIYFGVSMIIVFALTFCFYGWPPFASFLTNAQNIYSGNGITFRECSIDSVVRAVAVSLRTDGTPWVWLVKFPVLAGLLWGVHYSMRQKTWQNRKDTVDAIFNALPLLLFVMVFASPLVWEHHFVFLSLPFLLLIKKMQSAAEWIAYSFAYVFIFLCPTFDFFPLSFCRLAGAGILFGLCIKVAKHHTTHWFFEVSERAEQPLFTIGPGHA